MNPYKVLEINENATPEEITKAYRKLAKEYHPDKNKDPQAEEKFKEINSAYKKLTSKTDDEMHTMFSDIFGEIFKGFSNNSVGSPTGSPFGSPFGFPFGIPMNVNINGMNMNVNPSKINVETPLSLTLEDLYNGSIHKVEYSYKCKTGAVKQVIKSINLMGHVMQQISHEPELVDKTDSYEINIPQGFNIATDSPIIVQDVIKDINGKNGYGNLVIIVTEQKHKTFTRQGNDLHLKIKISLKEALTGFSKNITLLDNKDLCLNFVSIVDPYNPKIIPNYGFIKNEHNETSKTDILKGSLIINFHIEFPKDNELDNSKKELLKQLL